MGTTVDGIVGRTTSNLLALNVLPFTVTLIFPFSTNFFNSCEIFGFPLAPVIVKVTNIDPHVTSLTTMADCLMLSSLATSFTNSFRNFSSVSFFPTTSLQFPSNSTTIVSFL